jgi:hypothetical protein
MNFEDEPPSDDDRDVCHHGVAFDVDCRRCAEELRYLDLRMRCSEAGG